MNTDVRCTACGSNEHEANASKVDYMGEKAILCRQCLPAYEGGLDARILVPDNQPKECTFCGSYSTPKHDYIIQFQGSVRQPIVICEPCLTAARMGYRHNYWEKHPGAS